MKTFEDLIITIKQNKNLDSKEFFDNGYGISIVRNSTSYTSNNILDFEVAVLVGNRDSYYVTYSTPITDDVIGYCSPKKVSEIMKEIQELPKIN